MLLKTWAGMAAKRTEWQVYGQMDFQALTFQGTNPRLALEH
jgi:hypothetical protein